MDTTTMYCAKCAGEVSTKQVGQKVHCAKCNDFLKELATVSAQTATSRPPGFGTSVSKTRPRGIGWG